MLPKAHMDVRNKGSKELYGASSSFLLKWVFRGSLKHKQCAETETSLKVL